MNKDYGTDAEESRTGTAAGSPSAVVAASFSSRRGWRSNRGRKPAAGLIALILIVIAVGLLLLIGGARARRVTTADDGRIRKLLATQDCRASAVASTASLQPTTANPQGSIDLLTYRSLCESGAGHYQAAISALEQQAAFYAAQHDAVGQSNAANEIRNLQATAQQANQPAPRVQSRLPSGSLR